MGRKKTIEEVRKLFKDRGLILVSTEYIDAHHKLQYICPKHSDFIQEITYNKVQNGKGCPRCANKVMKRSYDEVFNIFKEHGYELLETEYKNSTTKMRYKCPNHPDKELYITLSSLLNGHGCPYCSGVGRRNYDEVFQMFNERGYDLISTEYKNATTKLDYRCRKHPDVIQSIQFNNFQQGQGCRFCGLENKKMPHKKTIEEVKQAFENKGYILLETEYINNATKMKYICPKHEDKGVQEITYNDLRSGVGCKYCGNERTRQAVRENLRMKYEDFIKLCASKSLNVTTTKEEYYSESNPLIKYYCSCSPETIQEKYYTSLKANMFCKFCREKELQEKQEPIRDKQYLELKEKCEQMGYELITEREEYKNTVEKVIVKCPKHGEFFINFSHLKQGRGCPKCTSSVGENLIRSFLIKNDIIFEEQKTFSDLKDKSKLSYDFYLPNYRLLIEFQGEFHTFDAIQQTKEQFEYQQKHDKMKKEYAELHNFNFLEIWHWDRNNVQQILEKELNI